MLSSEMACNDQNFLDLSIKYKTKNLFDTLVVAEEGVTFKAHEIFLSEKSGYFKAFFEENSFHDRKNDTEFISINLPFCWRILSEVLDFIYTGNIRLCQEYVCDLAEAADFLLIDDLMMKCSDFMLKNISLDNSLTFLITSYFLERLGVKERCIRFVSVNFNNILLKSNSDISKLPFILFHDLIKGNSLKVADEYDVWEAIVIWVESEPSNRLKHVRELLSCIRWSELSSQSVSRIAVHPILKRNEFCAGVEVEKLISLSENECKQITGRFPAKIHFFSCDRTFMSKLSSTVPPVAGGNVTDIYMTYDEEMDMCRKICETTDRIEYIFAAGHFIFTVNATKAHRQRLFTAYDLLRNEWKRKSPRQYTPMETICGPVEFLFVQCKTFIFALPRNQICASVEYYDHIRYKWIESVFPGRVMILGASVLRDKLYVVAHATSRSRRMRVLVYDTASDVWSYRRTPKRFFKCGAALINFRNRMFLIGGYARDKSMGPEMKEYIITSRENGAEHIEVAAHNPGFISSMWKHFDGSVEVYDPELNEWVDFPPLPIKYRYPQAAIVKDKLIVYQDVSNEIEPIQETFSLIPFEPIQIHNISSRLPICTWNEKTEAWDELPHPPYDIDSCKFCFIGEESMLKSLSKENKDAGTVWDRSINWNAYGIDDTK